MNNYIVYVCGMGCGYTELARPWHSAPIGNLAHGELGYKCPECGGQMWDYRDLSKREAVSFQETGRAA